MKKRLLTLLLTAAFLITTFAACAERERTAASDPAPPAADDSPEAGLPDEEPGADPIPVEEFELPDEAPVAVGSASYAVVEAIAASFSTREFTDDPVADADLELILQSGVKAPSARNIQPWRFTVVRDASRVSQNAANGTVAVIVSGMAEEMEGVDVSFDCGLATENLYIAAQSLGYGAHIYAAGVSELNGRREELGIPEGYDAVVLLLIGHTANPVDAVSSATVREALSDIVNYVE